VALEVIVEDPHQDTRAALIKDLDLEQIPRKHGLAGEAGMDYVSPRRHRSQGQLGQKCEVDQPRIVALDQRNPAVAATEVLAVEALERVDVLDLLDRQHVGIHAGYAIRNRLALFGRLAQDQTPAIGAEAMRGRVGDGERRRGVDDHILLRKLADLGLIVEALKRLLRLNVPTDSSTAASSSAVERPHSPVPGLR
jgi:hypothetical protein